MTGLPGWVSEMKMKKKTAADKREIFGEIADGTLNYYAYKLNDSVVTVDATLPR